MDFFLIRLVKKNANNPNKEYIITGISILLMLYHVDVVIITTSDDNSNPIIVFLIEFEHMIPCVIKITGNSKYIPNRIYLLSGNIESTNININISKLGNNIGNAFFIHFSLYQNSLVLKLVCLFNYTSKKMKKFKHHVAQIYHFDILIHIHFNIAFPTCITCMFRTKSNS